MFRGGRETVMWRGRDARKHKSVVERRKWREHFDLPARASVAVAAATGSARAVSLHIDSRLFWFGWFGWFEFILFGYSSSILIAIQKEIKMQDEGERYTYTQDRDKGD
jgi:hypothetical protein